MPRGIPNKVDDPATEEDESAEETAEEEEEAPEEAPAESQPKPAGSLREALYGSATDAAEPESGS